MQQSSARRHRRPVISDAMATISDPLRSRHLSRISHHVTAVVVLESWLMRS